MPKVFDVALEAITVHRTYSVHINEMEGYYGCRGCAWMGADISEADIHLADMIDMGME